MDTHFKVGDRVKSTTNAQGLVDGREYTVAAVHNEGFCVTYELRCEPPYAERRLVRNGHLLLEAVPS